MSVTQLANGMLNSTELFNRSSLCQQRELLPGKMTIFAVTHGSLFVALLGIPANVFALLVLKKDPSKTTTRFLLMVLAVEDLFLIFIYALYYVAPTYNAFYHIRFLIYLKFIDALLHFLMNWIKMAEIYTVLLVTLDRFIAIHFPLKAVSLCRVSNAIRSLIVIGVVSFLVKIPNEIIEASKIVWVDECHDYVPIHYFKDEPWFFSARLINKNIVDQVLAFIIPSITLIVLNTCLIVRIRSADNERRSLEECKSYVKRDTTYSSQVQAPTDRSASRVSQRRNITITLICVITIFLICETPTTLIYIIDMIREITNQHVAAKLYSVFATIAVILMFVNCASNFFVYVLIGKKFRNLFLRLFCRKSPCCFPPEQRHGHFSRMETNEDTKFMRTVFKMKTSEEVNGTCGGAGHRLIKDTEQRQCIGQSSGGITECYLSTV